MTQILGMVQNMSVFACPNCNHSVHIFGCEGVLRECKKHHIEFLGDIPLNAAICRDSDQGKPTVVNGGVHAEVFADIATKVRRRLFGD